jgi:hypothetical protein
MAVLRSGSPATAPAQQRAERCRTEPAYSEAG